MSVVCRCDKPIRNGGECMKCGRPFKPVRLKRRGPSGDDNERRLTFARKLRTAAEGKPVR